MAGGAPCTLPKRSIMYIFFCSRARKNPLSIAMDQHHTWLLVECGFQPSTSFLLIPFLRRKKTFLVLTELSFTRSIEAVTSYDLRAITIISDNNLMWVITNRRIRFHCKCGCIPGANHCPLGGKQMVDPLDQWGCVQEWSCRTSTGLAPATWPGDLTGHYVARRRRTCKERNGTGEGMAKTSGG